MAKPDYTEKTNFVPCYDGEQSPPIISNDINAEQPTRIDLKELSLGDVIEFHGIHPDSYYFCKIIEEVGEKKIKIWFKGRYPGAIAPLEDIGSVYWKDGKFVEDKSAMELNRPYCIPHFYYKGDELFIDPSLRMEQFTAIYLKRKCRQA